MQLNKSVLLRRQTDEGNMPKYFLKNAYSNYQRKFMESFDKRPFIAYRRNTNLHRLIRGNRILKNKVVCKNTKQPKQLGRCSPCLSGLNNLCCKQVKQTETFQSYRTRETFQTFHSLAWECKSLIYLLQCRVCQLHYVGKSETSFNIHLNNNRKDAQIKSLSLRE